MLLFFPQLSLTLLLSSNKVQIRERKQIQQNLKNNLSKVWKKQPNTYTPKLGSEECLAIHCHMYIRTERRQNVIAHIVGLVMQCHIIRIMYQLTRSMWCLNAFILKDRLALTSKYKHNDGKHLTRNESATRQWQFHFVHSMLQHEQKTLKPVN